MQGAWHFPSTTSTIVLVLDHAGLTLYNITPAEKAFPVRHPVKCWETMLVDFLDLLSFLSHKKEAKYVFVVICTKDMQYFCVCAFSVNVLSAMYHLNSWGNWSLDLDIQLKFKLKTFFFFFFFLEKWGVFSNHILIKLTSKEMPLQHCRNDSRINYQNHIKRQNL